MKMSVAVLLKIFIKSGNMRLNDDVRILFVLPSSFFISIFVLIEVC